jgi:hypothetical protein
MLWLILACSGPDEPTPLSVVPVDLTEALESGQTRAGQVVDDASLFGGIASEGQTGDWLLYNDRVRFVVQDARESSYYLGEGGGIIDADIVRPAGTIGRDHVDEWMTSIGGLRLLYAESVELISDGREGVAEVVVRGYDVPLALAEGAVESYGLLPSLGLEVETRYRLLPDSWLLEVTTTITASEATSTQLGDVLMGGPEDAHQWSPRGGLDQADGDDFRYAGYLGQRNDVAVGLVAGAGTTLDSGGGLSMVASLIEMVLGFGPAVTLQAQQSSTYTRYYGVAPDLATLSDAKLALDGQSVRTETGTVTAPDGPVAGARVHLRVDEEPYTVAVTNADGVFTANVPEGANVDLLATGRGRGLFIDTAAGAAPIGAYTAMGPAESALTALRNGATTVSSAQGRGVASSNSPLELGEPARVTVSASDSLPFEVQFTPAPVAVLDPERETTPPHNLAAAAWALDGEVEVVLPPGHYAVLAHRGIRFELHTTEVDLVPGSNTAINVELPAAYDHTGYLLGDPHQHGSPSGDSEIPLEERLAVSAGVGLQVHFGTDHDHIANYRPVVKALGLNDVLRSVVSDEMSPVLRGHVNIFGVTQDINLPNGGAWSWWAAPVATTQDQFDLLRARHPNAVFSSNHPMSSGIADAAGWVPGSVDSPDFWTTDYEAIEVNNSGRLDGLEVYLDLVTRGHRIAALGVSDSHSHFSGDPGLQATWFATGTNVVSDSTEADVVAAIRDGGTVATRGVFLELSATPGSESGPKDLSVKAHSPSWIGVDRLLLFRNGVEVERVDGRSATFTLNSNADAVFHVVARGDTAMLPVWSDTAWAITSGYYIDVDGNGWQAPLPPLTSR